MKNIPGTFMTIQTIIFICDFSNVQKCNFKECPLTWVAPLTMFLLHCDKIKNYSQVDH